MANIETGVAEALKPADNISVDELSSMFAPATVEPSEEQTEPGDTGEQSPADAEEEPVEEAPSVVPEPEE